MTSHGTGRRRRRRRSLISRKFSGFLLVIGLLGVVIGLGLAVYAAARDNRTLGEIAVIYLVVSVGVLLIRLLVLVVDSFLHEKRPPEPVIHAKPGFSSWKQVRSGESGEETDSGDATKPPDGPRNAEEQRVRHE
ncbi:MAG: hypothetical protein C0404_04345 [Verrucomicrobia bacterium]|nr:hypothetical protein [Verrucomicrobiota bacterium]